MNHATLFLAVVFGLVALAGTLVVLERDPAKQALTLSFYGMLMAVLFMALQAPDVALSEIAVGTAALPMMILITLATLTKIQQARAEKPPPPTS